MVMTNKSHVMQWGDLSFTNDTVSQFFGGKAGILMSGRRQHKARGDQKQPQIGLHRLYLKYDTAESSLERMATAKALEEQIRIQYSAEGVYTLLAEIAYPGDKKSQHGA